MNKKPVSKNPRTNPIKKDQIDPIKKSKGILKKIGYWIFSTKIGNAVWTIFIAFIFFILGLSKKDIEPINNGVIRIEQNVSQLRQDILLNNDYKKYLEIYQLLYKNLLEKSFPGGYTTFGVRNNTIYNPGNFNNKNIQGTVEGTISFRGKNCSVAIYISNLYFVNTHNTFNNLTTSVDIENYEIGKLYKVSPFSTSDGWKQYIAILSDDITNPVFVFGIVK